MATYTEQLRLPLEEYNISHARSPSLLKSLLPAIVKARLPAMASFRHGSTDMLYRYRPKGSASAPASGSQTPRSEDDEFWLSRSEEKGFDSASSTCCVSQGSEEISEFYTKEPRQVQEQVSGIGWKFTNQGLSLISSAVEESSTIYQSPRNGDPALARQLYIHALTYLLRGLPSDMSLEEKTSIRSALPVGVAQSLEGDCSSSGSNILTKESSRLHRTVAMFTVYLFVFAQMVLPYIRFAFTTAYYYECEHKISRKILNQGMDVMDSVGKKGAMCVAAVCRIGDGRVGEILASTIAWFVEGVAGGLHEGIGEGMLLVGAVKPMREDR